MQMKTKILQIISVLILAVIVLGTTSQPAVASTTISGQSTTQPSGLTDPAEFEAFLDGHLAEQMETHHIPGVVFTMVKDGEVFFSKAYGYADLEDQIPMDLDETILTTASLAKLFTAIGVLQIQDRGLIELNEDVRPHLTEFELKTNYSDPLTFTNLLTHTDGFEFRMMGSVALTEDNLLPLGEYVAAYSPIQIYPPGENLTYSDFASNLAGYLTQEISDLPFEAYMAENILTPLGMADSTFYQRLPQETRNRIASGYDLVDGEQVAVPELYMNNIPAGGFRTTAADMNKLMLALLNGEEYQGTHILEPETVQMMFTRQFAPHPQMGGITYGLFEHLENGHQLFFRDGDGSGTRSRMVMFPAQNLGFFLSYNSGDSNLRLDIISAFINRYYPAADADTAAPMDGYQARADRYSGTYRVLHADTHTFGKSMFFFAQLIEVRTTDEGYLKISATGGGDAFGGFEGDSLWVEVAPLYFERMDGNGNIAFIEDENGKVVRLISEQGYHGTFMKLPWYETQSFHMILVELVVVLLISMLISTFVMWPLSALIRKWRKLENQNPMPWGAAFARIWAAITCGMFAMFTLRAIGVLYAIDAVSGMPNFVWGISPEMVASLNSIYLPALLALALPIFTLLAWLKGWWKTSTRVYYTFVTLGVFAGLWWTHYWNLLGFRM
jgi:CubicO group peptidase (beta-lactamase class C family)